MYYITTPIPYANGKAHLGHVLEVVFNDVIARYKRRLMQEEVKFQIGADQHGMKILRKANKEGLNPKDFVKQNARQFIDLWDKLEISYTDFIETASPGHYAVSQILWKEMVKKNFIYKKTYQGLYCIGDEAFVSKGQLRENGMCPNHDEYPVEMKEENYFFKLSEFTEDIARFLKFSDIRPEKIRQEWVNFLESGLEDISISREKKTLSWGVPVPNDESQVMYVWFEALINYLTALVPKENLDKYLQFPDQQEQLSQEIIQIIKSKLPINQIYMGKDMPKFHLIVWIGILTALGFPLTKTNLIHGFINDAKGKKFSKSLGNGVYPEELLEKFGIDGTRFVMITEVNPLDDTNFDWERVINSYNANLADNIGNLVIRVTNLIEKYFAGNVYLDEIDILDTDKYQLLSKITVEKIYKHLENLEPQESIKEILSQFSLINQYLEETKPWTLAKNMEANQEKIKQILLESAKAIFELAKPLSIFLPASGEKIIETLSADRITKSEIMFNKVETGEAKK